MGCKTRKSFKNLVVKTIDLKKSVFKLSSVYLKLKPKFYQCLNNDKSKLKTKVCTNNRRAMLVV